MTTDEQLLQGKLFDPDEADFRRLPRRALTYWRVVMIRDMFVYAVLTGLLGLTVGLLWLHSDLLWAAGAVFVPVGVWSWIRYRTAWRIAGYCLGDEQFWVRGGIGTRMVRVAPYGRIQNCDVINTFLSRKFRLASVSVAVGTNSRLTIENIDPEEAARIRTLLADLALKRGVQL